MDWLIMIIWGVFLPLPLKARDGIYSAPLLSVSAAVAGRVAVSALPVIRRADRVLVRRTGRVCPVSDSAVFVSGDAVSY